MRNDGASDGERVKRRGGGARGPRDDRPVDLELERVLAGSLRLAYIPIVVLLLAALGAFVYGTYVFIHSVQQIADHPIPVGHQIGKFLLDVDLFLIGATLLISVVGFYELFVREIQFGRATQHTGLARDAA